MLPTTYRVARIQKTLRWFEEDIPLLNMRVRDLSAERQRSAHQFAAALVEQLAPNFTACLQNNRSQFLQPAKFLANQRTSPERLTSSRPSRLPDLI